jgi:hypothetical protein
MELSQEQIKREADKAKDRINHWGICKKCGSETMKVYHKSPPFTKAFKLEACMHVGCDWFIQKDWNCEEEIWDESNIRPNTSCTF